MAKKKSETTEAATAVSVETENPQTVQEEVVETQHEIIEVVESEVSVEPAKPEKRTETEIPDEVKNILKVFADIPELYVNPKTGGTFDARTKPSIVGNAILYKNPFYRLKNKE
jgi:hypothetical protein